MDLAYPDTAAIALLSAMLSRYEYSDEDLAFLMTYDTDSFNRWEAGQQLAQR